MKDLFFCKTKEADIEAVVIIETDKENSQFIMPNSKKEHFNLLADKDIDHLMIKTAKNKIIGFVILAGLENETSNFELRRIVITEKGKGFGRKAIKEIKKYCFEQLNCHRLWLDVFETNVRARHLYQSEGFKEKRKLREGTKVKDEFKTLIIMSILDSEFRKASAKNPL